jgi:hypothetical protein
MRFITLTLVTVAAMILTSRIAMADGTSYSATKAAQLAAQKAAVQHVGHPNHHHPHIHYRYSPGLIINPPIYYVPGPYRLPTVYVPGGYVPYVVR